MIRIDTPIGREEIDALEVGMQIEIYGRVLCARDAVLPRIVRMVEDNSPGLEKFGLEGAAIFHTAVSPAGIGPTTSNKVEIESSMPDLSRAGVRLHLGKGALNPATVEALEENGSVFAVTPPVSALFSARTVTKEVIGFEEEGMEALVAIVVRRLPAIVAAARGRSIFNGNGGVSK